MKHNPFHRGLEVFLLHNTHMARVFRSPTQYYFVEYKCELCLKAIKINTKKRTIYFRILFYILKGEGGDITCQTIIVEAAINY